MRESASARGFENFRKQEMEYDSVEEDVQRAIEFAMQRRRLAPVDELESHENPTEQNYPLQRTFTKLRTRR